jgi:hypothetical protein
MPAGERPVSAKTRKVELGNRVAVEYVRPAGALRVHGPDGTVDCPLAVLLNQLGVQAADVFPVRRYLLFAGRDDRRSGGMGDLVGLFDDEHEARAAFQRARLAIGGGLGWAHLVVMEPSGRLDRLCWFGREPEGVTVPDRPVPPTPKPEARRSWSRRNKRQAEGPAPPPPPPPAVRGAGAPPDETRPILAAFSEGRVRAPAAVPRRPARPFPGGRRRGW